MIPGKRKNSNALLYETSVSTVALPTNGFNNVTNCPCFNCCVLKLLGNSATNEKQLHATPSLVGIG
jgi:hypothetical protein